MLTSITGRRYSSSDIFTDMDSRPTVQNIVMLRAFPPVSTTPQTFRGATLDVAIKQRFTTQELRLNGSTHRLDWLLGG